MLEYFPEQKKIFLAKLIDRIRAEEFISADLKIHEMITQYQDQAEFLAFDVPMTLPTCLECRLKCPGYEACSEPEIKYLHNLYQHDREKKKPKKMFTPYTQRCVDTYLGARSPELEPQHAMGANLAPLTARARYISRRVQIPTLEVFPRLSVWEMGLELKVNKSTLRSYRNSVGGEAAREVLLKAIAEQWHVFFYEQDRKTLVESFHAFDAFICAYTALLQFQGKTESRPRDLPRSQTWIGIPYWK